MPTEEVAATSAAPVSCAPCAMSNSQESSPKESVESLSKENKEDLSAEKK